MKEFQNCAAQGELRIKRIDELPANIKPLVAENGVYIIGHSETGHHHVMTMDRTAVYEETAPPAGMRILYAVLDQANVLEHQRPHDTHEAIKFQPGTYEIRSGREFDPYAELARHQAD